MAMNLLFTTILTTIFLPIALSQSVAVKNCWRQICLECGQGAVQGPGLDVQCNVNNAVHLNWLNTQEIMPVGSQNVDYVCIKMTASNSDIIGDSTDVIRGCAVRMQAETLCTQLTSTEQARGKKDAKCWICEGDNCNGGSINTASGAILVFVTIFISKCLFY